MATIPGFREKLFKEREITFSMGQGRITRAEATLLAFPRVLDDIDWYGRGMTGYMECFYRTTAIGLSKINVKEASARLRGERR